MGALGAEPICIGQMSLLTLRGQEILPARGVLLVRLFERRGYVQPGATDAEYILLLFQQFRLSNLLDLAHCIML